MSGAVVILAIAGDGEVAIDREIVLRFPGEGAAGEALAFEPRRPFIIQLEALAKDVADDPIKSSTF